MNHYKSSTTASATPPAADHTHTRDASQPVKTKKQRGKASPRIFVPLADETRYSLDTAAAAHQLNRKSQTLRYWASTQSGPIRPMLINGRLAWPCAELRRVLGVAA